MVSTLSSFAVFWVPIHNTVPKYDYAVAMALVVRILVSKVAVSEIMAKKGNVASYVLHIFSGSWLIVEDISPASVLPTFA